jgi:hypothetical protein
MGRSPRSESEKGEAEAEDPKSGVRLGWEARSA